MKRIMLNILLAVAVAAGMSSCKEDWTVKNVPPIPEVAQGFGYVSGFENGGSVMFAVEAPAAGTYTVEVVGRGTTEGSAGTGEISCGTSSAPLTFSNLGSWAAQTVSLQLQAGTNDIIISAGQGNGLFHIDYIELK